MAEEENKQLVQRFFVDVLGDGQLDLIDKLVAEDFVDHEQGPGQQGAGQGRQAAREVVETFREAFPDLDVSVDQLVAEDDIVTVRTTWRGTHEGELMGLEATDETVEFTCIDIVRIEDGLARERWGLADELTILTQIGETELPG